MPLAYSDDLKWGIIYLNYDNYSISQIMNILYISKGLVRKVLRLYKKWGNVNFSSDSDISFARVVRSYVSNSEELPLFSNVEFDVALSFFAFKDNLNASRVQSKIESLF